MDRHGHKCSVACGLASDPRRKEKRKSRYPDLAGTEKEKKDEEEKKDKEIADRTRAVLAKKDEPADSKAVVDRHFEGTVYRNTTPNDASLSDLFTGEEIANFHVVDVSRLQAFFFTMILVLTYAINTADYLYLAKTSTITELPALGASGLSLLAISQGIYLTSKAVPKKG